MASPTYMVPGALDMFNKIGLYFNLLKHFSPGIGYYPKDSKSVAVVHMNNPAAGREIGLRHGYKVRTGARYLGSLLGMTNPNVIV